MLGYCPALRSNILHHRQQSFPSQSPGDVLSTDDDEMPIPVFYDLHQWLIHKNMQGFIKVAKAEPHPQAEALMEEIDVSKITNKKVRQALGMQRGGFDVVKKVSEEGLRSYFGEYSPSAKRYQTYGGRDEFFHEVARFLLEIGFVSPRFYCMPKKRAGFIIATYEGKVFD